jgi:hypothetical protein
VTVRERLSLQATAAGDHSRYLDLDAANGVAPVINPMIHQQQQQQQQQQPLATALRGETQTYDLKLLRAQRDKEAAALAAAQRAAERQHQLNTGLDLEPWRRKIAKQQRHRAEF